MPDRVNPLEELTEEMAQIYVELVNELVEEIAPVSPWWSVKLTQDQQLWRWMSGPREQILSWLMAAGVYMGWKTWQETLDNLDQIFTSPVAPDAIPPDVVIDIPPELLEMVQAAGPVDTAKQIRKMEKLAQAQAEARQLLSTTGQPNVPEPPLQPPPLPVELAPGTEGYPLYGEAPTEPGSKFGLGSEVDLAGH